MIVKKIRNKHPQVSLCLQCHIPFDFSCSEGDVDTPLKQLVPITEMLWLITDTQLTELHNEFRKGECRFSSERIDVARRINVSSKIVRNWWQQMRYTYAHNSK